MNKKLGALLVLVALAGVAAASTLTIGQRTENATLFAERYTINEAFTVDTSPGIAPAAYDAPATGAPIEMTAPFGDVRMKAEQDDWVYTVVVKENAPNAVGSGNYSIVLQLDGVAIGTLEMTQESANASAVEGVVARFALGKTVQTSALYFVSVRPILQVVPPLDYTVESKAAEGELPLRWQGVGGSINGASNPTLPLSLGTPIRLKAINSDDEFHNIGFVPSASSTSPLGPGWSAPIDATGEEATITWTPSSAGTYYYRCQFHPGMVGQVVVT